MAHLTAIPQISQGAHQFSQQALKHVWETPAKFRARLPACLPAPASAFTSCAAASGAESRLMRGRGQGRSGLPTPWRQSGVVGAAARAAPAAAAT